MGFDESSAAATTPSKKYRVLAELGSGGMARVYLAVAQGLAGFNKLVVLKVLRGDLAFDAELRDGFLREARVSARMNHPNVVVVNEVDERDGIPVIVMEHLQGQAFSAVLRRMLGKSPVDVPLRIFSDSLSGLHYAHELADYDGTSLGLVHRDFTPQNIFVTYDGSVKVLDFGIAQVNRSDTHMKSSGVKGKLRYMAPEQIFGTALDRRTDVFAAGIVLSEIVAGRRFWGDLTDGAIIERVKAGAIPTPRIISPACSQELDRICTTALAFDRNNRYQSVAELQQDVEAYMAAHSMRITTPELGRQIAERFRVERRDAQQLIETSLSNDTYVSWSSVAAASVDGVASKTPPATATQTVPDLPRRLNRVAPTQPSGRRRVVRWIGQAAGVLLLLGGAALLVQHRTIAPNATLTSANSAAPVPKTTRVRITTFPAEARLAIDEVPIAQNPFVGQFPADDRWHRLQVQALGHKTVEQKLQFLQDVELVISLETEESLAAVPTPSTRPPPKGLSNSGQGPRNQTPTSRSRASCSPPYTYDQRGLKHFKPECL